MERRTIIATTAALTAGVLAGCASSTGGGTTTTTQASSGTTTNGSTTSGTSTNETTGTTTGAGAATVAVRSVEEYGDVLVGPDGKSLYMFEQDSKGKGASTCSGNCAGAWPPLTVSGKPTAGQGVTAKLTTFDRDDGSTQVAAAGWPLYYFAGDDKPGDANGQGVDGFGAKWYLLAPDGAVIREESSETTTTTKGGY